MNIENQNEYQTVKFTCEVTPYMNNEREFECLGGHQKAKDEYRKSKWI